MDETLVQKQQRFALMVKALIGQAADMGYKLTFGECWRTKEQAEWNAEHGIGIRDSLHCERLAIDLNLFRGTKYLTNVDDYKVLGKWWEGQGGAWGGHWGDGNHFSLPYDDRK
jgi:hypothetical protein